MGKDIEPEAFGFVHPRFGQRTVSAILDGHAGAEPDADSGYALLGK